MYKCCCSSCNLLKIGDAETKNNYLSTCIRCMLLHKYGSAIIIIGPLGSGCTFPYPHLKALGSATHGQDRERDSTAVLGNSQDKRLLWQTYSGWSAMDATRPESQAAPPHNSIFRDDCHLPAMNIDPHSLLFLASLLREG